MKYVTAADLVISTLGPCTYDSPLLRFTKTEGPEPAFTDDEQKILLDDNLDVVRERVDHNDDFRALELAGPRRKIFFDPNPEKTVCAIVTCGGLCPGLNNVIRGIVMQAWHRYGLRTIYGIPYGYEGLNPDCGHTSELLNPTIVSQIHRFGGTYLGSSRGPQDVQVMVDTLERMKVNILFVVGGDGSQRGALAIFRETQRRGRPIAVVGVPKTVDDDIMFMDKSFGYETAFTIAVDAIEAAHTEALGARNGVGLVKLMGRDSGFIACAASIALGEANYVLIPEVPFSLEGPNGLFADLADRLKNRTHAVIVVAEGAGQHLMSADLGADASGNKRYADIGLFLRDRINEHFKEIKVPINLKYIDPSYIIRSAPAVPDDSVLCFHLARHAVHAAMAGKTGLLVGRWHSRFVHVPTALATASRRKVEPQSDMWQAVLEVTGQPARFY